VSGEPNQAEKRARVASIVGACTAAVLGVLARLLEDKITTLWGAPAAVLCLSAAVALGLFCIASLFVPQIALKTGRFFLGLVKWPSRCVTSLYKLPRITAQVTDLSSNLDQLRREVETLREDSSEFKSELAKACGCPEIVESGSGEPGKLLAGQIADLRADRDLLRTDVVALQGAIQDMYRALRPSMKALIDLHTPGETRKQALLVLKTMLTSLASDTPLGEVQDQDMAAIIWETADEYLASAREPDIRQLVFQVRRMTYDLRESSFPLAKRALRDSAERMLGNCGEPLLERNIHAYAEVINHADQWPFRDIKGLSQRLSDVQESRDLAAAIKNGMINIKKAYATSVPPRIDCRRVWKRVWPNVDDEWGRIACVLKGSTAPCTEGVLGEVSLGGVSCRKCVLQRDSTVAEVQLTLPKTNGTIKVHSPRFVFHRDDYFPKDGSRKPGFSIEFLDMHDEDKDRLAGFVRDLPELSADDTPLAAPWLRKS